MVDRYDTAFNGVYLCVASLQGHCRGWGHRVRRSLGRGCHYLGLSVLNITNYIVAEATFMDSLNPSRNYNWDYIYTTNEYGVKDYMYD